MRRPIDIVLPDTGPLITLAVADRLDLLTTFNRAVLIPDVVKEEALAKPGSLGYERLAEWLGSTGHNQYRTIETPFLDVYRSLRAGPPSADGRPATKGLGEATLMWVIANIERFHAADATCLVITQDGRAGEQFPDDVHVLSTRSWLQGLENRKIIKSVYGLIADVESKGRKVARYSKDRRGTDTSGKKTDWISQVSDGIHEENEKKEEPEPGGTDRLRGRDPFIILITKSELNRALFDWPEFNAKNIVRSDLPVDVEDALTNVEEPESCDDAEHPQHRRDTQDKAHIPGFRHVPVLDGRSHRDLLAFGPLTRGTFGEMTGAPDISRHIERIAVEAFAKAGV